MQIGLSAGYTDSVICPGEVLNTAYCPLHLSPSGQAHTGHGRGADSMPPAGYQGFCAQTERTSASVTLFVALQIPTLIKCARFES